MIRILHLTDFHLNIKTLQDWNDFYKNAFFQKLDQLHTEKPIDLIVFTGDLIDKGGISFKEKNDTVSPETKGFQIFKENIITPILEKLNLDISRFIICPGNHDINRDADDEIDEIGLKNALDTTEKITHFITKADDNNSFKRIERIKEYKNFEKQLYLDIQDSKLQSIFKFSLITNINGKKIGITSLNSSWRCYDDNDFGNILIGEKQVNDNYKFIEDCDIKIALVHHQLDWLNPIEQKIIKNHTSNNFDLLFSGHVHTSLSEYTQASTGNCVYCVSPSGLNRIRGNNIDFLNGFTLVDYGSDKIDFHYLNYNHSLKKFVDNTNVADKGMCTIKISNNVDTICKTSNQRLEIDNDFLEFLNDSGANFTHRSKTLLLNDIYIYPFLEKFSLADQEDKSASVKSDRVLEKIINNEIKNTVFLGEENSGKTSLCKTLYTGLITNKDVLPVYIKGKSIKKASLEDIENLINKEIRKQYKSLPDYSNLRKVIIVDDFNNCGMTPKSKRFFLNNLFSTDYQSVITWDEFLTLSELLESQAINLEIYEVLKFGAKKRYELICKWVSLFSEDFENEVDRISHINQLEKTINSVIGKNLVPSQPIYILTILQTSEITNNQNFEQSTFGHYYDVLIKSALGQKIKDNKEIEKYYSYLSELSFWLYNQGINEIDENQFISFHHYFKNLYRVSTGFVEMLRVLEQCSIITNTNGLYKFKYKYIHFYFVGKYLSDNIEEAAIQDKVKLLSNELYQTDSANIYLFLSHHSKSKFIINQILINAKALFEEQPLLGFNDDIKQINDLIEGVTENIGFDNSKSTADFKNEALEISELNDNTFEDGKESIDSISKVNKAFKTIEILGYIIKNRYASLKGNEKQELVDELYQLGLRTLSFIFKTLLEGEEFIKGEIIELIKKDTTSNLTAGEREGLAKQYMFNILYMVSYSIFKKLSSSISSKDLEITFHDVKNSYPHNNAIQLIDMAVIYEYSKIFPFKETELLVDNFKSNKLSYFILRRLGVNFMRMMPMKEIEQQKAGELLEISMKTQRLLGGTSKIAKK